MTKAPSYDAPPGAVGSNAFKSSDITVSSPAGSDSELKQHQRGKDGAATFAAGGLRARLYAPIEKYEGRHRYDPDFEWEEEEERRVVRKVSWLVSELEARRMMEEAREKDRKMVQLS